MHQHSEPHFHAPDAKRCWYREGRFIHELSSHLPFSVLSVTIGLLMAGTICFLVNDSDLQEASIAIKSLHDHDDHGDEQVHDHADAHEHGTGTDGAFLILFHLFHPAHMLFSAAATAAMFRRYERGYFKAILVGISGAIVVCGISDIIMPYLSALVMGKHLPLHLCILNHPMLVIPFALTGVAVGLLSAQSNRLQSTIFSHSMHVFSSTMASIFYLIGAFGRLEWINEIGMIFLFIALAVVIPCCLSDIVYPLLFTPRARQEYVDTGHTHPS